MGRKFDLTGQTYGKLTVNCDKGKRNSNGAIIWNCLCECGKDVNAMGWELKSGRILSCGRCNSYRMSADETYLIGTFSNGREFFIDISDYERVKYYNWYRARKGYAASFDGKTLLLHRLILDAPDNIQVDHINGVKYDNRRSNLRFATAKENMHNTGLRKDNQSGAKGVYYDPIRNKYEAGISIDGRKIHLGRFSTLLEAANIYDRAAENFFGEFAYLNNLSEKTPEPVSLLFSGKEKELALSAR